ncbi:unnamed protein product [Dibothriocephalus latus]|uniref:Uncharacterized protein n=1 Tax=Dibothriocephalus latus TaxID=60516 RepID=A0A3P7NAR2_DIBLA|nr:unnamed protein product [Dibothriocephalus latus]
MPDAHIAEREKENAIDPPNGDLSLSPYTTAYQPRQAAGPTESAGLDTVLQKIQSALEQSRRVREQVMQSEMDTEVAAAVANAGFQAAETICRLGGDGVMPRDLLGVNMDVVSFEDEELDALEGELDLLENGLEDVAPDDSLIADLFYSKRQINTSSSAFYGNVLTPEKCFESLLDDESTTKMEPPRSQAALSESTLPVQRSVGKADQAGTTFGDRFDHMHIFQTVILKIA